MDTDKLKLTVLQFAGDDDDEALSRTLLEPEVTGAYSLQNLEGLHSIDALRVALGEQTAKLKAGDMTRPEAMLLIQAHTLDSLFNKLLQRAYKQDNSQTFDTLIRTALRVQNQCRCTLETLSNIKNPPVVFAKQANISQGHQQINNGVSEQALHVQEIKNQQNKLLEEGSHDGKPMDIGAASEAIRVSSFMETLGKKRRP